MSHSIVAVIIVMFILGTDLLSVPRVSANQDVWYTQIGQWHLQKSITKRTVRSSTIDVSFLSFDNQFDSARSGLATANVRLNKTIHDIQSFSARLAAGPAPSIAGLLIQNKESNYYFMLIRGKDSDSLQINLVRGNRIVFLASSCINISDTTNLSLVTHDDTLILRADKFRLCIAIPPDFSQLTSIGFECPKGSVKVFSACIESRDFSVDESFDNATLINLHLDRMLKKN